MNNVKNRLLKITDNFKGKKIGVVGDIMLDHFIRGDVERISPEAPVPVVLVKDEITSPGGAANTANNISALGGTVCVVGLIGSDPAGEQLIKELRKRKINTEGVLRGREKPTTQKIRIITGSQQILRVDKEKDNPLLGQQEKKAINFITSHFKDWSGLVISDYAKGFVTKKMVQVSIRLARKYGKFVICNPKPKNLFFFKNATLLTLNKKEAEEATGVKDIKTAGKIIQKKLSSNILITQGAEGMTLFEGSRVKHFPTVAKEVFDVMGAGDTVVATLSLVLASGAGLKNAVKIANQAAGIAVNKVGTTAVFLEELRNEL